MNKEPNNEMLTIVKKPKLKGDDGYATFSIRIPETLKDRIVDIACKSGYSRNSMIISMLEYACDHIQIIDEPPK